MHKTRMALRSLVKRLAGNEDGVVAIEFGVIASFLILMLIGATDLGFAARHRSQMEGAVRAGIQEAMKGGTEEAIEAGRRGFDRPAGQPDGGDLGHQALLRRRRRSCGLRGLECHGLYGDHPGAAAHVDPGDAGLLQSLHPQGDQFREGRMMLVARRRLSQLRRDQRGVAAVEFAMIAPIFFGLLIGIMDVGRYMWTLNTIQYAIDQGVRAGVVQQLSTEDVTDLVKGSLAGLDAGRGRSRRDRRCGLALGGSPRPTTHFCFRSPCS